MTSTITASRHACHQAEPTPWVWDSVTAPIPVTPRRMAQPRAARPHALRWIGSGVLAGALLGTGAGAYALGHHDAASVTVPAAAAATPAARPVTTIVPSHTAVAPAGPQLVDTAGRPVEDATAAQVRVVYTALQQNDVEALKRAEGAAGSDDGLTSFPHLTSATARNRLLDALRTRPVHHGTSYRYRAGSYALEFQQADGPLGAGLGSISGPWSTTTTPTTSPTTTSAPSTSVFPYGNEPTMTFLPLVRARRRADDRSMTSTWTAIRAWWAEQNEGWEAMMRHQRPWEQEGPLRWARRWGSGWELHGSTLPVDS